MVVSLFGGNETTISKSYDMRKHNDFKVEGKTLPPSLEAEVEYKTIVPDFKKNCLIEFVKDNWSRVLKGKLNTFESLCKFTNQLIVLKKGENLRSSYLTAT